MSNIFHANSNFQQNYSPPNERKPKKIYRNSFGIICLKRPHNSDNLDNPNNPDNPNNLDNNKQTILNRIQNKNKFESGEINTLDVLMVCPKYSYGYIDFIRGKYTFYNISYILNLFEKMTRRERENLMEKEFLQLWTELWEVNPEIDRQYYHEYLESKNKFLTLKNGFPISFYSFTISISMESIIKQCNEEWNDPEWGFPKGRKNINESNQNCALREFSEETGIPIQDIQLLPIGPIEEKYEGTNHKVYCHYYYIAEYIGNPDTSLTIDYSNPLQYREVGKLEWVQWREGIERIRPYFLSKKDIMYDLKFLFENIC
jgi:8-oxo-dGTP pyrophosphatase MutT (NUDIX family)